MPRWEPGPEELRKAVHWAMVDAWQATIPNSFAPPEDFSRSGGKIVFRPGPFADKVAALLLQRGLKIEPRRVDGTVVEFREAEP
jgi:hypothetical protein